MFMILNKIIGSNLIIQNSRINLNKTTIPHAQLIVDENYSGGLIIALYISLILMKKMEALDKKLASNEKISSLFQDPDLLFLIPLPDSKSTVNQHFNDWMSFIESSPFGDCRDWLSRINYENANGIISTETVNNLHKSLSLKSYQNENKICIIWESSKLNDQASNKLLKLLEDPPKNTYFILTSNSENSILPTIRSRCQITKIPRIKKTLLSTILESVDCDKNEVDFISKKCDGNMRIAMSLLEKKEDDFNLESFLVNFLRIAYKAKFDKKSAIDLINWSNKISSESKSFKIQFLIFMEYFIREAMLISYKADKISAFKSSINFDLKKFSKFIHSVNIEPFFNLISISKYGLERNANSKILFSNFSFEVCELLNLKES